MIKTSDSHPIRVDFLSAAAIAAVRRARPSTVENSEQDEYVSAFAGEWHGRGGTRQGLSAADVETKL